MYVSWGSVKKLLVRFIRGVRYDTGTSPPDLTYHCHVTSHRGRAHMSVGRVCTCMYMIYRQALVLPSIASNRPSSTASAPPLLFPHHTHVRLHLQTHTDLQTRNAWIECIRLLRNGSRTAASGDPRQAGDIRGVCLETRPGVRLQEGQCGTHEREREGVPPKGPPHRLPRQKGRLVLLQPPALLSSWRRPPLPVFHNVRQSDNRCLPSQTVRQSDRMNLSHTLQSL
jgi:hypothetical protein